MRTFNKYPYEWNSVNAFNYRMIGVGQRSQFQNLANASKSIVERLTQTDSLDFHVGCVNAVNFNSTGDLIASGSDDLQVAIWDWLKYTKEPKMTFDSGHTSNVFQTKFMPNTCNSTIVTCGRDGQVRVGFLTSSDSLQMTKRVAQHKQSAHKLSIEPGSPNLLKTAGEDAVIYNIDLREPKPTKLLTLYNDKRRKVALYGININPNNPLEFAVAGRDPWARIYDVRKINADCEGFLKKFSPDQLQEKDSVFAANVTCLMYNYNGSELLVSYNDDDIYLFDTTQSSACSPIHKYSGHRNSDTVKGVNFFGPCSEYIVSGSDCGHIFIWDKKTEQVVTFLKGDDVGVVNVLEPHPDCCVLATSGLDHDIKIWQPLGKPFVNTEELKKQIKRNEHDRIEDRNRDPDPFDNQLIYMMMQHLQRQRRRISRRMAREGGDELSDSTTNSDGGSDDRHPEFNADTSTNDSDDDSDDDDDDDEDGHSEHRCVQS